LCKKEQEAETLVRMLVYSQNNEGSGNIFFLRLVNQKKCQKQQKKIQIKAKKQEPVYQTVVRRDIVVFLYLKKLEGLWIFKESFL